MADGSTRNLRLSTVYTVTQDTIAFTRNLAVIIGINEYANGIPRLQTAGNDAARLAEILLKTFGYDVMLLADADIAQRLEGQFTHSPASAATDETTTTAQLTYLGPATLDALRTLLTETLPAQLATNDRLLFYFAGHGVTLEGIEVEEGPVGYLIPQDAHADDRNTFWSMTEFYDLLTELPCRHMLVLLDCCFAGALRWVTTRDMQVPPQKIYRERYEHFIKFKAWQAITSSAYDQKALDILSGTVVGARGEGVDDAHSPFALALFDALAGAGDTFPPGEHGQPPGDGLLTASELYQYLRDNVELKAKTLANHAQSPGLWPLRNHHAGEFVFLMPNRRLELEDAPPLTFELNPYRGLQPFEEEHKAFFFGRAELVEELAARIDALSLTVVLGASGTGKSSLVKAGVIPTLRNPSTTTSDGMTKRWTILPVMRPTDVPLAALRDLLATLQPDQPTHKDADASQTAVALLAEWCRANPDCHLLLVIDQFEELVTLCTEEQRTNFLGLLRDLLRTHREHLHIVLTLRSDFAPQFATALLPEAEWMAARVTIPAMTQAELRAAIVKPAEARVLYFDPPELVDTLIEEVNNMPGALPLLSFTLSEMYIKYIEELAAGNTTDRALTAAYHQELGGVIGSLSKRATGIYEGFDEAHRATMRRVMLRMVAVEGGELARRRVPLSELVYPSEIENTRVAEVIRQLVDARLVVTDSLDADGDGVADAHVEPAHDALVRAWDRLLRWKQGFEEYLNLQRTLTAAADEWKLALENERTGLLWNNNPRLPRLQSVLFPNEFSEDKNGNFLRTVRQALWPPTKVSDKPTWLNQRETDFVQSSVARASQLRRQLWSTVIAILIGIVTALIITTNLRTQAVSEAGRRAEAEAAATTEGQLRATSDANAGEARRAEATAVIAQGEAEQAERVIQANQLALQSRTIGDTNPPLSLLLSAEAANRFPDEPLPAAMMAAQSALQTVGDMGVGGAEENVAHVAFSPDGTWLALRKDDNALHLRTSDIPTVTQHIFYAENRDNIGLPVFSPSGERVAVVAANSMTGAYQIYIWRTESPDSPPLVFTVNSGIHQALFSPDERWLAFVSEGRTVRLWDINAPGTALLSVTDNADVNINGRGITFSRDGRWLAYAEDSVVRLWDVENANGTQIQMGNNQSGVQKFEFSPDNQLMAIGAHDGRIRMWNVNGGAPYLVQTLNVDAERGVSELVFSPNSRWLAAFSFHRDTGRYSVLLWDTTALNQQPIELLAHEREVAAIDFSMDSQWLASGSQDNTIRLWRTDNPHQQPIVLRGHEDPITAVKFSPDGHWLFSTSGEAATENNMTAWRWDMTRQTAFYDGADEFTSRIFSRNGRWMAAIYAGSTVFAWDMATWPASRLTLSSQQAQIDQLFFSADGGWLASTSSNGILQFWEMDQAAAGPKMVNRNISKPLQFTVSPDNRWLAVVKDDLSSVEVWEIEDPVSSPYSLEAGTLVGSDGLEMTNPLYSIGFSPDSDLLAASGVNNIVYLWETAELGNAPRQLKGHSGSVYQLTFTPDGRWLASAGQDRTVRLWNINAEDVAPGTLSFNSFEHEAEVWRVAVSPDSRWVASASADSTVHLWDISQLPKVVRYILTGHNDDVWDIAFSHDSRWLVSASTDGTIRLWNVSEPNQLPIVLEGPEGDRPQPVVGLYNNWLLSRGEDGIVRVRNIFGRMDEYIALACRTAGRNLSTVEWQQYFGDQDYQRTCPNLPGHFAEVDRLLEEARTAIRNNDQEKTAGYLATAQSLDPSVSADAFEAEMTIEQAINTTAYKSRNIREALAQLERARNLYPAVNISASQWSVLCSVGVGTNQVEVVLDACDRAVLLSGAAQYALYARGLARIMISDYRGAIDDLSKYVEAVGGTLRSDEQEIGQLERWISALETGLDTPKVWLLLRNNHANEALRLLADLRADMPQHEFNLTELNEICTSGGMWGDLSLYSTLVLDACDQMVEELGGKGTINRGFTRALSDDIFGAGKDFQAYKLWADEQQDEQANIQFINAWMPFLEAGLNPVKAYWLANIGQINEALTIYESMEQARSDLPLTVNDWQNLCWKGTIYGHVAKVSLACKRAEELAPDDAHVRQSQAVMHALSGQTDAAIEDMQYYILWMQENQPESGQIATREEWLEQLMAGEDPATIFDEETLEALQRE